MPLYLDIAAESTLLRVERKLGAALAALSRLEARMSTLDPIKAEVDQILADNVKLKADVAAVVAQQKFNAQTLLDLKAQLDGAQGDPAAIAEISDKLTALHGDMTDTAAELEAILPAVTTTTTGSGAAEPTTTDQPATA